MTNQTFLLNQIDRESLLQEFDKVAEELTPPLGLLSSLKETLRTQLCLKLTVLIQSLGYNKQKIIKWKSQHKEVIINIGSLGSFGNSNYLNGDLLLGVKDLVKVFFNKLDYDLLLNISSCDNNIIAMADGIFISHVLEHIPPSLALTSLKNCLAYLKPGGGLRVVVPDLESMDVSKLPNISDSIRRTLNINRGFYGWGHKFMYNLDLLTLLMEEAGFTQIQVVSFREGFLGETDLSKYKDVSIYITGIKA